MSKAFLALILVVLFSACSSAGYAETPDATPTDPCADPANRQHIWDGFQSEVLASNIDLSLKEWLINHMETSSSYKLGYIHARCRTANEIKVLVTYFGGTQGKEHFFKGGWTPEKEERFRSLIEAYTESIFPDFDFRFHFNLSQDPNVEHWTAEEVSVVVVVGYEGAASYAEGKTVHLIYSPVIGHEMGHLCPNSEDSKGVCFHLGHHYCGDDIDDLSCGPPTEAEGSCIMTRNGSLFGPTEQFVSRLTYLNSAELTTEEIRREMAAMLTYSNMSLFHWFTEPMSPLERATGVFERVLKL